MAAVMLQTARQQMAPMFSFILLAVSQTMQRGQQHPKITANAKCAQSRWKKDRGLVSTVNGVLEAFKLLVLPLIVHDVHVGECPVPE
jgi:hypothetical protein